jgi:hypothetical protein
MTSEGFGHQAGGLVGWTDWLALALACPRPGQRRKELPAP